MSPLHTRQHWSGSLFLRSAAMYHCGFSAAQQQQAHYPEERTQQKISGGGWGGWFKKIQQQDEILAPVNSLDLNYRIGKLCNWLCNPGYWVQTMAASWHHAGKIPGHRHPSFSKRTWAGPEGTPVYTNRIPQYR